MKDSVILHPIKPRPKEKFRPTRIKGLIKQILTKKLEKVSIFEAEHSQSLCKSLSTEIKEKIKIALNLERYKYRTV